MKIFLIIVSLILHIEVFAGAWVQKKKDYYFKVSGSLLYTSKEFNHKGKKLDILEDFPSVEDNSFRDISFTTYFEYGLFDNLTIIANLPFKFVTTEWISNENYLQGGEFRITTEGFGDLTAAARLAILREPLVLSIQEGLILPLGYSKTPENDGPRLGNGERAFESNLLFGKSLYPLPVYLTGGVGYRFRSGEIHDEILFSFETGVTLPSFIFKITADGVKNTTNPPDLYGQPIVTPIEGGGGVFPDIIYGDNDYLRISPSIIYRKSDRTSFQVEMTRIIWGRNFISGNIFSFSLIMQP